MKVLTMLNSRKRHRKARRSSRRRHNRRAVAMNPRKRRGGRRRGGSRRSSMSARGVMGAVKQAFSKDLIMTGAGVFATGIAWQMLLSKTTTISTDSAGKTTAVSSLPGGNSSTGALAWRIAFPIVIGAFSRRFSPSFSNGAYLYGISNLINTYVAPQVNSLISSTTAVAGTSAYLRPMRAYGTGYPFGNRNLLTQGVSNFPGQKPLFAQSITARR